MTKVKICGIQTVEDGLCVAEAGADYIGFVFAKSKRQVSKEQAKTIIDVLPENIEKVGVFVDTPLEEMEAIADFCGLDILQLHGNETASDYGQSKYPIIKSVSVKSGVSGGQIEEGDHGQANYLLFDTWHKELAGGSGKSFEWQLLTSRIINRPYFLAGGLTTENIKKAIGLVAPFGVDVSSGVETHGIKDPGKIKLFVERVKEVKNGL